MNFEIVHNNLHSYLNLLSNEKRKTKKKSLSTATCERTTDIKLNTFPVIATK